MFRNIGKTIQRFAIILAVLLFLIFAVFGALCLLTALEEGTDKTLQTAGIQAAVISFVLALLLPTLQLFLMYGFGALIRDARQQAEDARRTRDMLQAALADGLLSDEVARKVGQVQAKLLTHLPAAAPAQQPQNTRAPMQRPVTEPTYAPAQRPVTEPAYAPAQRPVAQPVAPVQRPAAAPVQPPVAPPSPVQIPVTAPTPVQPATPVQIPTPVTRTDLPPAAPVELPPVAASVNTAVAGMAAASAEIVSSTAPATLTPDAAQVNTAISEMATASAEIVGAPTSTDNGIRAKDSAAAASTPFPAPSPAIPLTAATLLRPDEDTF